MSDFQNVDLLIENMDAGFDGPLSTREVACVNKGWDHGRSSAESEVTALQAKLKELEKERDTWERRACKEATAATDALADKRILEGQVLGLREAASWAVSENGDMQSMLALERALAATSATAERVRREIQIEILREAESYASDQVKQMGYFSHDSHIALNAILSVAEAIESGAQQLRGGGENG